MNSSDSRVAPTWYCGPTVCEWGPALPLLASKKNGPLLTWLWHPWYSSNSGREVVNLLAGGSILVLNELNSRERQIKELWHPVEHRIRWHVPRLQSEFVDNSRIKATFNKISRAITSTICPFQRFKSTIIEEQRPGNLCWHDLMKTILSGLVQFLNKNF